MDIVAVDIGGTHARFALAEVQDGLVAGLGEVATLRTADHASLQSLAQHVIIQLVMTRSGA